MQAKLAEVCSCFRIVGDFDSWEELKVGNINKTYRVTFARENGMKKSYILQKVNTFVFPNPEQVMENIERVTQHLRMVDPGHAALHYHHTRERKNFIWDGDDIWRMCNYIPSAGDIDTRDETLVRNAGFAFGEFQYMLSGFNADELYETIPNFHNTVKRYDALEAAVRENPVGRAAAMQAEIDYLLSVKEEACLLCRLQAEGKLPLRVTHNDTKVNNVLFDKKDHRALVVIDLDTVMPGLTGNDFGDAIRSVSNTAAEDDPDVSRVSCDLELFRAFTDGFLEKTARSLTETEIEILPASCFCLTVELAVRFLTDYLLGDSYFYCAHPEHNRDRTRNQIALARDIHAKQQEMKEIIAECLKEYR